MDGAVSKKTKSEIATPASLLEEISIRGLGVIDETTVEFAPGLNVITGETGAGKTMLLTALSLLLGGKSDASLVRSGAERMSVSGRFSIAAAGQGSVSELVDEQGGEIEEGSLLFTRIIGRDGKSRATVGGASSTATVLNEVGSHLIAIHGQHASLALSKTSRQRELLDTFGGSLVADAHDEYLEVLQRFKVLRDRVRELRQSITTREREISELQALVKEFEKLKPRAVEVDELSALIARLTSVEDLREAATGAISALDSEENGALNGLGAARRFLATAKGKDGFLDEISEVINEAFFSSAESAGSLRRYLESLNADPLALDNAQQRKASLLAFAKKYGDGDFAAALSRAQQGAERIEDLQGGDETLRDLENQARMLFGEVRSSAQKLTEARKKAAAELSRSITRELALLSMPNGKFEISITTMSLESNAELKESGADEIEMLFTSHGGDLLPIAKAASGGELSRLLLAIEVTIAGREERGTYVFDEVDAGIGGKAALEVGRRLRVLADRAQVIVVTHLPQVAIWADRHIVISKSEAGSITTSSLSIVDGSARESEIARMLSGLEDSEHAQEHARELLELRKARIA